MKYLLFIWFVFCCGIVHSQSEIILKAKVKEGEVLLRWTPIKSDLFLQAAKYGYTLYRKEWEGAGMPAESFWKTEPGQVWKIMVPTKDDSAWKEALLKDEEAGLVHSFLFPEKTRTKMDDQNYFGLTLLACDLNISLAEISGLFFHDSTVLTGKKYAYRIEINTLKKSSQLIVSTNMHSHCQGIESGVVKSKGKSAEISWNYKTLEKDYSGYHIERSDDSLNFRPLNDRALIPMASQFEKEKEITYYTDTTVEEGNWYWYRLKGQDHFGEYGDYSKVLKVFISPLFRGEIRIDTLFENKNQTATLSWSFSLPSDKSKAQKMQIWRARSIQGKYELLKEVTVNETQTDLSLAQRENYIKVIAIHESGNMESWPSLLLIPDRFPPSTPDSLTGIIDKHGIVSLKWKYSPEKDCLGYRVFRSNDQKEEMVEVTKRILTNNQFTDSVDIHGLTEEIYFSVNAVDSSYNNSTLSLPLKLQKPDYIAPTVGPIVGLMATEKGNKIRWNRSTSKDVLKTEIKRSKDGKTFETVFMTNDTIQEFLDTTILPEKGYYYKSRVEDDALNFTESEMVYLENPLMKGRISDSVEVKVDRAGKSITLIWQPLKAEVYSYP